MCLYDQLVLSMEQLSEPSVVPVVLAQLTASAVLERQLLRHYSEACSISIRRSARLISKDREVVSLIRPTDVTSSCDRECQID